MRQLTVLSIFVLSIFSTSSQVVAEHNGFEGHEHEFKPRVDNAIATSDIKVSPGEAIIIVHGIVCSFCSQGVARNLSKLVFVDKTKYNKGVKVEIEDQKVTIAIKANETLELEQVFKSILKGGYEPIEAYVSHAEGNVSIHKFNGGQL